MADNFRYGERVVLDANVLIGFPICDTILTLAESLLITPIWSSVVLEELRRNLMGKFNKEESFVTRRINAMVRTFPEATVEVPQILIDKMSNAPEDRHVLGSAVFSSANFLVTFNLKDFKGAEKLNVKVMHPDEFLCELYRLFPEDVIEGVEIQLAALKNPPKTISQLANDYKEINMRKFATILEKTLENKGFSIN
jgi:predicted nucleic acid-binding protein